MLFISGESVKTLLGAAALFLVALSPRSLAACSMVGCLGNGIELRQDFEVKVTHDGQPLSGVTIQITGNNGSSIVELFSRQTGAAGKVHLSKLPPGDYWLRVDLLGILAGSECFHVSPVSSRMAKREISFEWGDEAPAAREAAGKLIHTQAGDGARPIWNITHPVHVPISNARLSLRAPQSNAFYSTTSDNDGQFKFGEVPEGLYVLRVEGGATAGGRGIEPVSLLFRLSHSAPQRNLFVDESDAFGGRCGGWSIEPDYMSGL